ncbi:aspartate/glutamate racemase family protein [Alginatibacterium sediminis]|uniref:Aspartate/glutamate racemase family protein n=1 Tax=Alginatibacterium sediminis TaxID=2164068 RepID=A0A420E9Q8_9ALTE|nr:aspartate/glutamate racemase family protein [Alginatibacterium sediminis]RKF17408.1 aspartate/glutamate racemase family protein [Alginatibacterium sediminis]
MKTIGLLGGMSWQSTTSYYQAINQGVSQALGGLHSAKICLVSVDFAQIEALQHQGRWDETAVLLTQAAQSVQAGGADFLMICTNTMHKVAAQVESGISIPLLHIADATAQVLQQDGITTVGLLGTQFTMQQGFYKDRLRDKFGVQVLVPSETQQQDVHRVIYEQLCHGIIKQSARERYLSIIDDLYRQGAQAVILGCTEIALLVEQEHTDVPLYDTTQIHAQMAVTLALEDDK